jgi:arylsulfatase A-like enzyme
MDDEHPVDRTILPIPERAPAEPSALHLGDQRPAYRPSPRVEAPDGAPNVVVILLDDMGFGASSAFGGPCEMPTADRLAENGLRYSRFHTTAICSATRAALLTGRNHHAVGFGHLVETANAAPGYNCKRPDHSAALARILAGNGYATGAFGKWHQTPTHEATAAGPIDRWPTGKEGFQKFYGFLAGQANHWYPTLYDGTALVDLPPRPEGTYHLSEDLVDQAIGWIGGVRSVVPDRPFFCYLAFGATHSPFHVSPEWVERYRGRFDGGWEAQRELTLERQRALGVIPSDGDLTAWPSTLPRWDELDDRERRAAAMLMELYAGFAEHTDAQVGRFVDGLAQLGVLDDTLILYVLGDNGASAESERLGTHNESTAWHVGPVTADDILAHADELGSGSTYPNYAPAWALAMDTPYAWYKQVASHYGGTRNGLIVHWPDGIEARKGLRHQWHHVIDVAPTILEAAGIPHPAIVDGVPQSPLQGSAMNYSFDEARAPDRHVTQYFEIGGSRGIYHEGWVACTAHRTAPSEFQPQLPDLQDDVWELYDTNSDWTQAHDLADFHPEKLAQLKELFLVVAARHQVLPIEDRSGAMRFVTGPADRGVGCESIRAYAGARRLPHDIVPRVINASHVVSAAIVVHARGASGVICAQGGSFSGWSLYLKDGVLTYCHNLGTPPHAYVRAREPLAAGPHEVRYEFAYDGGGLGKGGVGRLYVDDRQVGEQRIERTAGWFLHYGEGFDVGVDLASPVSDEYPQRDNELDGEVVWVRVDVGDRVELTRQQQLAVDMATQ